jgi:hypothetical protein
VLLLPLIAALSACAEGGIRGSGISTFVVGNVAIVQTAMRSEPPADAPTLLARAREFLRPDIAAVARAGSDIEGISVAIEGTNIRGRTDAEGDFMLQGDFEGVVNLVFNVPNGGGQARIQLNVPAGGRLTLVDMHLDTAQGVATAATQDVDFDGLITAVDCPGQTLTMVSSQHQPNDTDDYTVRLDTSTVTDSNGAPVACEDINENERAIVWGVVNPDGTFGEATIQLKD